MLHIQRVGGGGGQVVVVVAGQVDLATAPQLAEALALARREAPQEIVADLTKVDFLDSVGVRVLVEAAREAGQQDSSLSVRGATGWVARVLEITGVEDYLRVIPAQPAGSGEAER